MCVCWVDRVERRRIALWGERCRVRLIVGVCLVALRCCDRFPRNVEVGRMLFFFGLSRDCLNLNECCAE